MVAGDEVLGVELADRVYRGQQQRQPVGRHPEPQPAQLASLEVDLRVRIEQLGALLERRTEDPLAGGVIVRDLHHHRPAPVRGSHRRPVAGLRCTSRRAR